MFLDPIPNPEREDARAERAASTFGQVSSCALSAQRPPPPRTCFPVREFGSNGISLGLSLLSVRKPCSAILLSLCVPAVSILLGRARAGALNLQHGTKRLDLGDYRTFGIAFSGHRDKRGSGFSKLTLKAFDMPFESS